MADELVEAVARDRFAKKCLDVFNAGIVRRPDAKNPRRYTDYYSPYEAMMAVIALVREAEPDGQCQLCGEIAETRPYGPNGQEICFECGMKDEATTKRQMGRFLFGDKP